MARVVLASLAVGFLIAFPGCSSGGPGVIKVTGQVTFDGTPLPEGTITFKRAGDLKAFSGEIKNGAYEVPCEEGDMVVEITASREVPGKFDTSNPGVKAPLKEQYIPAKYSTATTLSAKVDSGHKNFSFDLKSK
ncbi:MAG: hypothetical protein J0I06_12535 [Planctomycetes bacterium]|nr:hypothetical protein [Planctomycetota bacterium]